MNILLTLEQGETRTIYFPEAAMDAIRSLGNLRLNDSEKPFTEQELAERMGDADVCLTHWGCPRFTKDVLDRAPKLRLIAHAAGSVAGHITDEVYNRGIRVCSSNEIMAKYVAEGILAYMLSALRMVPRHDRDMKAGVLWNRRVTEVKSLYGARVGFIGLGTVGRYLLKLLQPFDTAVRLYDPYCSAEEIKNHAQLELRSLEEVLSWADVISVHASLTAETYHMLNAGRLGLIRDGALLINCARGAVFNEDDLVSELETERFSAVLDVFEEEPLPLDHRLRHMKNVTLNPHMAGKPAREQMTFAMADEIGRWINGQPLIFEIPYQKYKLMTNEKPVQA